MKIKDFFKRKKKEEFDIVRDLSLSKMKKGYMVDYDLETLEVSAYNYYDWGNDDISHEWQLRSGNDIVYLEMESDDGEEWSLNRKIAFASLDSQIKKEIIETGDPPEKILFEGVTYYIEETSGGHFYKDGSGIGKEVLQWSYQDDEERHYLCVEQWGEEEFEASTGEPVEEYQFTNILPR